MLSSVQLFSSKEIFIKGEVISTSPTVLVYSQYTSIPNNHAAADLHNALCQQYLNKKLCVGGIFCTLDKESLFPLKIEGILETKCYILFKIKRGKTHLHGIHDTFISGSNSENKPTSQSCPTTTLNPSFSTLSTLFLLILHS